MIPNLKSSVLVKRLKDMSKSCSDSLVFYGLLEPISDDLRPILEYIRQSFPSFPSHGLDHSLRIIQRVGDILSPEALKILSPHEIFSFVIACFFHDAGMANLEESQVTSDEIRIEHHNRSSRLLKYYFKERLALFQNERVLNVISFAIESHNVKWNEMALNPIFKSIEVVNGNQIRPAVLAILLRIGDLLDLDSDRTNETVLYFSPPWLKTGDSKAHHDRHRCVTHFFYDHKKIEVDVKCSTSKEYEIWSNWFDYLRQDIEKANTYIFRNELDSFQLPIPILNIIRDEDANFEIWPLRFEIDDTGRLWDVISQSLYTGRYDFIREITQNGIDACLRLIFDDPQSSLPQKSPRNWELKGYHPFVSIIIFEESKEISIVDNGIGMTKEDLETFLFRIAACGIKSNPTKLRNFSFPSIAQFGVGFISVLVNTDSLTLNTLRHTLTPNNNKETIPYEVKLDANLRDALIEPLSKRSTGTAINLKLKHKEFAENIFNFLSNFFLHPSVPILLVDWDRIVELTNLAKKGGLYIKDLDIVSIKNAFIAGTTELAMTIKSLSAYVERIEKEIEQSQEKKREEKGAVEKTQKEFKFRPLHIISSSAPRKQFFNETLFFQLSESFDIERIDKIDRNKKKPINILNKIGLIIIPFSLNNLDLGIEWHSLHTFIVANGNICREVITKFSGFGPSWEPEELYLPGDEIYDVQSLMGSIEEAIEYDSVFDMVDEIRTSLSNKQHSIAPKDKIHCNILQVHEDWVQTSKSASFDEDGKHLDSSNDFFEEAYLQILFDKYRDVLELASEWYRMKLNTLTQDGMLLPIKMPDLLFIGATVGNANFMADARFPLNVARNAIDQSKEKIEQWKNNVGYKILEELGIVIRDTIWSSEIEGDWGNLWGKDSTMSLFTKSDWNRIGKKIGYL